MLNWQMNNKENALVTLAEALFGHYKISRSPVDSSSIIVWRDQGFRRGGGEH